MPTPEWFQPTAPPEQSPASIRSMGVPPSLERPPSGDMPESFWTSLRASIDAPQPVWRGLLAPLWGEPMVSPAKGVEDLAPIMAGPLQHQARLASQSPGGVTWHRFAWGPTEESVNPISRKYAPELFGSGTVEPENASLLRDVLLSASEQGETLTKKGQVPIGFEKLRRAWGEVLQVLEREGIGELEFHPVEGKLTDKGPEVSREARTRLFEWLTGNKAVPSELFGHYRLPVKPKG